MSGVVSIIKIYVVANTDVIISELNPFNNFFVLQQPSKGQNVNVLFCQDSSNRLKFWNPIGTSYGPSQKIVQSLCQAHLMGRSHWTRITGTGLTTESKASMQVFGEVPYIP